MPSLAALPLALVLLLTTGAPPPTIAGPSRTATRAASPAASSASSNDPSNAPSNARSRAPSNARSRAPSNAPSAAASRLPAQAPRAAWRWPLDPTPRVLRRFAAPPTPYASGHRGVDLRATTGDPVLSVGTGRVTHVGSIAGRGTVSVLHPGGIRSTYEPVTALVRAGEVVAAGGRLGTLSGGGHCDGGCLHLGAVRGTTYLDPLVLLRGGPVILLPLT